MKTPGHDKRIYVLHEYGNPTHYDGLKYYCNRKGYALVFHEFSILHQLYSGLKERDGGKIKRAFQNLTFVSQLLFTRNKKIILGIAPFDYRMIFFDAIATRHTFFYHTSWPYWDWKRYPKKMLHGVLKKLVKKHWKRFLEEACNGIFCVTAQGKRQLQSLYNLSCPIEVVYHSVDSTVFFEAPRATNPAPLRFLFVGRLLEKKGLNEILGIFETLADKEAFLGIVGDGPLAHYITAEASRRTNIKYYGRTSRMKLGDLYREYDVLLCPSKKGYGAWEELFGMTIIEGMACGVVPVATNHVGPMEIIDNGVNGFLIREENLYENLLQKVKHLLYLDAHQINQLKTAAVSKAAHFKVENISRYWCAILKDIN